MNFDLKVLVDNGNSVFSSGNILFDLSGVEDSALRLRIVQALELGFRLDQSGSAPTVSGVIQGWRGDGSSRTIQFFDAGPNFLANVPQSQLQEWNTTGNEYGPIGYSGAALWLNPSNGIWNDLNITPSSASDLRIFINPTGGSGPSVDGKVPYWKVVNLVWHEGLHLAITHHHNTYETANNEKGYSGP